MSDFLYILLIVIISPLFYIIPIAFWTLIGAIFEKIIDKLNPPEPPYCDIDPKCHIGFYRDIDGNEYVNGVKL